MNVRARGQSDMSVDVLKRSVILDHLTRERRGLDLPPAPSRCDAGQYQASCERQARNALLVRQVTRLVRLDRHHAAHALPQSQSTDSSEPPSDPQGDLLYAARPEGLALRTDHDHARRITITRDHEVFFTCARSAARIFA